MTMNVTPKIVSGRVVKISSFRSLFSMSKKTWAPSERPIQLRWISFSESLHVRLITEIAPIAAKIGRLEPKICATASAIPTESAVLTAR